MCHSLISTSVSKQLLAEVDTLEYLTLVASQLSVVMRGKEQGAVWLAM